MRYILMNDLHVLGPLQIMTFLELITAINEAEYPVILNGDIIDEKNCKKKEVFEAKAMISHLSLHKKCKYIAGNHEMGFGDLPLSYSNGIHYFAHSHMISNPEKYKHWNLDEMQAGAGWFKRTLITPAIESLRHLVEARPNDRMKAFIRDLKWNMPDLKTCIFSHSHPLENIYFQQSGVFCVITKRGINHLEVDNDGSISTFTL